LEITHEFVGNCKNIIPIASGNSIFTRDDILTVNHKPMYYLFFFPEQIL
jgi:hypothetical protein